MVPYGRQIISADDFAAVQTVLQSGFLAQCPVLPPFGDAVATRAGPDHAVAFISGTTSLHITCAELRRYRGDLTLRRRKLDGVLFWHEDAR